MVSIQRQSMAPTIVQATKTVPRKVRVVEFPSGTPVTGFSRPATDDESWSCYEFEVHARKCAFCHDAYDVYRSRQQLCRVGHQLAQDVARYVHANSEGHVYSHFKVENQMCRVEIPADYDEVRSLLRAIDRSNRHSRREPFVSNQRRSSSTSTRSSVSSASSSSSSSSRRHHHERSNSVKIDQHKHTSRPRMGEIVDWPTEGGAVVEISKPSSRRGSLYEADLAERRKKYRVEVREPSRLDLFQAGYYR